MDIEKRKTLAIKMAHALLDQAERTLNSNPDLIPSGADALLEYVASIVDRCVLPVIYYTHEGADIRYLLVTDLIMGLGVGVLPDPALSEERRGLATVMLARLVEFGMSGEWKEERTIRVDDEATTREMVH